MRSNLCLDRTGVYTRDWMVVGQIIVSDSIPESGEVDFYTSFAFTGSVLTSLSTHSEIYLSSPTVSFSC